MTDDKGKKGAPLQPLDPRTLGWWAHSIRVASGWSQETVAELSGLNVRTIQRVEAGRPSTVDTRRALAHGLNYDDVDFFNKPENAIKIEGIRAEICRVYDQELRNQQFPGCTFIDAAEANSGKELADFAEHTGVWTSGFDHDTSQKAKELFCSLVDYITEYGDVDELYSQTDKLNVHAALDDLLAELNQEGYGFYFASRPMKVTNENWKDKTPLRMIFGYMKLLPTGKSPVQFAVPKTDRLVW
jgi:transcriptional regulator with XRE-family HTH domain